MGCGQDLHGGAVGTTRSVRDDGLQYAGCFDLDALPGIAVRPGHGVGREAPLDLEGYASMVVIAPDVVGRGVDGEQ